MSTNAITTAQDLSTKLYHSADEANRVLSEAAEKAHLVSPATTCSMLPAGCGVIISWLKISPDPKVGLVYPTGGGKVALHKQALDQIAGMAGVSWEKLTRLDDRSDPWYCEYEAIGKYRSFDGQWQKLMDHKVMDLRDGSAAVKRIFAEAKEGKDPAVTLQFMRSHIASHCVTKARLRAIRTLGVRTSYFPAELAKMFAVAKIAWNNDTDRPDAFMAGYVLTAQAFLGSAVGLYGPEVSPMAALPQGSPIQAPFPPAKVSVTTRPAEAPKAPQRTQAAPDRGEPHPATDSPCVPFGKLKGTPLSQLRDDQLDWYKDYYEKAVDDATKARWIDQNRRHQEEIVAELGRRQAAGSPDDPPEYIDDDEDDR